MELFELVIALLFGGVVLAASARRLKVPYPALLAVAGAALALFPYLPSVTLDPELALALLVAPVLLDAAFDSSPRDLRAEAGAVAGLALIAVLVTAVAVAAVARWLEPALSWPAAVALGAIVAPPDAAAAVAVLKQLRPPHRLMVILEGESMLNDAPALLLYRLAVAAAVSGSFSGWRALPTLVLVVAGSAVLGALLSRLALTVLSRVEDVASAVIVQFLSTFAVWILAERLRLSGIITTVVFAVLVARRAPGRTPARLRVPSYAVWEVVVFVLNVLAFILIGLQLKPLLARLDLPTLLAYIGTAVAICASVVLVRIALVMGWTLLTARARRRAGRGWSLRSSAVVAWCGMRGIVTLAAALALPAGFPHRDLVLFAAFSVVLGTLVLQGATLAPLITRLGLEEDGTVDAEVRLARAETARAALAAMAAAGPDGGSAALRSEYEARLRRMGPDALPAAGGDDGGAEERAQTRARRRAQAAERRTLIDLRAREVIGDDAFHRVEEELDLAELNAQTAARVLGADGEAGDEGR